MLQIKEICKTYRTGGLTQQALDHVSLNLRDSEFVAILGQSGSGKTTLLNIVGGLDRYDEGDLIIGGVSTRKYSDRDWDSYRNHTVGFVFQSYNLIPHQTILANVELALTIGGISPRDRTRRAAEALQKVGLGAHLHKRPNQLSGGQMQRVAIARALVNDPDILLADEPTGALDSETSIQVMDLLQEVARDRLVVMVTHNPELAEQYATRIVNLKDGKIISDSDPFEPEITAPPAHRNMGKASMSFLTALMLSFNNLRTKKARTILVAFAGSIGIIGIAMILSLSNGVDRYIQNVEEETLQGYPLEITDTSFDLMSMYMPSEEDGDSEDEQAEQEEEEDEEAGDVREWKTITSMFSRVATNDLSALRSYLQSGDSRMEDYVQAIEYGYNLSPQIYSLRDGEVRQVNPDTSFAALGFSGGGSMNSLMSAFSSTDTFHPMPADEDLYRQQYEVKAGRWPEEAHECVVVLTSFGQVADMTLYVLGLKDPKSLDEMIQVFAEGGTPEVEEETAEYDYEDFLDITFYLVPSSGYYVYDSQYGVYTDKTGDPDYMRELVENGEELTIVGVVQAREEANATTLTQGIGYPAALTDHLMEISAGSSIVKAQMADRETDVFTGKPFGAENDGEPVGLENLFAVDEEAMADAFKIDAEDLELDFGEMDFSDMDLSEMDFSEMDLSGMDMSGMDLGDLDLSDMALQGTQIMSTLPTITAMDIAALMSSVNLKLSGEDLEALMQELMDSFLDYAAQDPATDFRRLPDAVRDYLQSPEVRQLLVNDVQDMLQQAGEEAVTSQELENIIRQIMLNYPEYAAGRMEGEADGDPAAYLLDYLSEPDTQLQIDVSASYLRQQLESVTLTEEQQARLLGDLEAAYALYAESNSLPDPERIREVFRSYLQTDQAGNILRRSVAKAVDTSELEERVSGLITTYVSALGYQVSGILQQAIGVMAGQIMEQITAAIQENLGTVLEEQMGNLAESFGDNFADAFQVDFDAMAEAISMNMDENELQELLASLMSTEQASVESNLRKLGYADQENPSSITIYPLDFESKGKIKEILDNYNEDMRKAGEEDKVITYTDVVDTLMSSVTDIVNAISYVLIAFVAISLVVSSIMIGVITYISVLERNKEIGILRAIGASKRNISQVFNAETFIIGGLAGIFGVVITWLLLFPTNHIIRSLTDQENIRAALPLGAAALLILLSIVLTLIGGIIPSRKAARSDPVAALRSD